MFGAQRDVSAVCDVPCVWRARAGMGRVGSRGRRWVALAAGLAAAAVWTPGVARAGNTWTGGGALGLWSEAANWGGALPTYGTLVFAGGSFTTSTNDGITSMNQLNFTGGGPWTINAGGATVLSLFDNAGVQAKIENNSTGLLTLSLPIVFAANNASPANPFGEINAVSGDIVMAGAVSVTGPSVGGLKFWGGGRNVTFAGPLTAGGKYLATTGAAATVTLAGVASVADVYVMNGGSLDVTAGAAVTFDATRGVRLGGDFGTTGNQNLAQGGTLRLTTAAGGVNVSGIVNTVSGNTSNTLAVRSMNTGGTNTLSGSVFLDSNLVIAQSAGGTLNLTGATVDVKNRALTVTADGTVAIQNAVTNSLAGGSVVMNGTGTLVFRGASGTYSGGTTLIGGTIRSEANNALSSSAFTLRGGTLDLGGHVQRFASLNIGTGGFTGTITNGHLIWAPTAGTTLAPQNVTVAGVATALNMAGLGSLTIDSAASAINIGAGGPNNNSLDLSLSAATNTVTASQFLLTASGSVSTDPFNRATVRLGQSNVFNLGAAGADATVMQISGFRNDGSAITFQPGLTNPTLRVRASNGTGRSGNIIVGQTSSGVTFAIDAQLDLGVADVLANRVVVGDGIQGGASAQVAATVTMAGGMVNATEIVLGRLSANQSGALNPFNSLFNQGGGTVVTPTLTFGNILNTVTGTGGFTFPTFRPTYVLGGGTLLAQAINVNPSGFTNFNAGSVRTLAWNDGTIGNYNDGAGDVRDLTISGSLAAAGTLTVAIATAGAHNLHSDAGRSVTINPGVNLSGAAGAVLTKVGDGALNLNGTHSFAGDFRYNAGTTNLNVGGALGAATVDTQGGVVGTLAFGPAVTSATFGGLKGGNGIVMTNTAASPAGVTLTVGASNANTVFTGGLTNTGSGTPDFNKLGTGTMAFSGGVSGNIAFRVQVGEVDVTGADFNASNLAIGVGTGTIRAAVDWNATGTVGNLLINDINNVGGVSTGQAALRVSGGSLTVAGPASATAYPWNSNSVVIAGKGAGTVTVSGGTLTVLPSKRVIFGLPRFGQAYAGPTYPQQGLLQIGAGALVDVQSTNAALGEFWLGYAEQSSFGTTFASTGTVRLDGGTLRTSRPIREFLETGTFSGTPGTLPQPTTAIRFNGGTLQASAADNANWIDASIDTVDIEAGGATIDTVGRNMGVFRPIGGVGALNKTGIGVLTLGAASSFAGGVTVGGTTGNFGISTLAVTAEAALGPASTVQLNSGSLRLLAGYGTFTRTLAIGGGASPATATLDIDGAANTVAWAGSITGSTVFSRVGPGRLAGFDNAGTTFTGEYTFRSGTTDVTGTFNSTKRVVVGSNLGSAASLAGVLNFSGTGTWGSPDAVNNFGVGDQASGGVSRLNITGGSLSILASNVASGVNSTFIGNAITTTSPNVSAEINVSGGTLTFVGGILEVGGARAYTSTTGSVNGSLNVSGDGLVDIQNLGVFVSNRASTSGAATGTINLTGGTLRTAATIQAGHNAGTSTIRFDGGRLLAGADNVDLVGGLTQGLIADGGVFLDDGGFQNVIVSQSLSPAPGSAGGIFKQGGAGTVTLTGTISLPATALILVDDGKLRVSKPLTLATGVIVEAGSAFEVAVPGYGSLASRVGYSADSIAVSATGRFNVLSVDRTTTTNHGVVVVSNIDLADAGGGSYGGFLDLGSNDMIVRGGVAQLSTLRSMVAAFLATGNTGIGTSATGFGDTLYSTIAIFPNVDPTSGGGYFASYDGVPVANGDVIAKYTYVGDTNLDGILNGHDFANLIEGLTLGRTGWQNGDLNYDGVVNPADYAAFAAAFAWYGSQAAPPNWGNGSETGTGAGGVVPEPSVAGVLLAALPLVTRRRRRT